MNYAFRNGKILDGTKEMKIQQGLCILVENGIITDLIPDANADLHNYKVIDLHGQYMFILLETESLRKSSAIMKS